MRWLLYPLVPLLLCTTVAAEVYRWTDDQGRVHYGERPPAQGAQRLDLPSTGPPSTTPDASVTERRQRQRRMLDAYAYERQRKQTEKEQAAARQQQLAGECERLQRYWRRLSFPGPIYVKGESGERRYLSDEQRAAEMKRLRPAYRAACGREP